MSAGSASFEQEARRPGAQRLEDVLVGLEGRQHTTLTPASVRVRGDRRSPPGRRRPACGMSMSTTSGRSARASATPRLRRRALADDHEAVLGVEQRAQPGPQQRLVVH